MQHKSHCNCVRAAFLIGRSKKTINPSRNEFFLSDMNKQSASEKLEKEHLFWLVNLLSKPVGTMVLLFELRATFVKKF